MPTKATTDEDLLARMDESYADDLLTANYSAEEIIAGIRAEGGDPAGIGQRGAMLARALLDKRRLAWQESARQKIRIISPILTGGSSQSVGQNLSRDALLGELNQARRNPVPMLLWCPECGERHIDEGDFAKKLHRTHACQHCGHCLGED